MPLPLPNRRLLSQVPPTLAAVLASEAQPRPRHGQAGRDVERSGQPPSHERRWPIDSAAGLADPGQTKLAKSLPEEAEIPAGQTTEDRHELAGANRAGKAYLQNTE